MMPGHPYSTGTTPRQQPPPVVRRVLLRSGTDWVDVEDHLASPEQLDARARQHMDWLRSGAENPAAGQTPEGRHYADTSDATVTIPAYPRQTGDPS